MDFDQENNSVDNHSHIWWHDAIYQKFYENSNITKFNLGRKLFNKRAITYFEIDEACVEAVVFDGKKGYYEVTIEFKPIAGILREKLIELIKDRMDNVLDIINGKFSKEFYDEMKDIGIDIFPGWANFTYRCTCKKSKKCDHVATVLHRIINEVTFNPILIFALRGISIENIYQIILDDEDFEMEDIELPEELTPEFYSVGSSPHDETAITPNEYYGTEINLSMLDDIKESYLKYSQVYHGKIRDEFYDIYKNITKYLKVNIKKF
ncbi:MAG: hypothetical protein JXR69_11790 [Candidatus Delongbacteria bacterium]|nr:hypothetical protein [Candidatus Delongbacteria bacterium]